MLILPLDTPLGRGVAPTVHPTVAATSSSSSSSSSDVPAVRLLATVDLPAGTELALGQVGPWPL